MRRGIRTITAVAVAALALDEGYVGVFDSDTGEPVAVIEPAWAQGRQRQR